MICSPCKENNHSGCPSILVASDVKEKTGLSAEGDRIQLSGLCPCQHRVSNNRPDWTELLDRSDAKMQRALSIMSLPTSAGFTVERRS